VADLHGGAAEWKSFLASAAVTFVAGTLLLLSARGTTGRVPLRGAFLLTTGSWLAMIFFGALPFQFGGYDLSFTDAIFETVSGLTTTGATVITGLDRAPPGLLLWRSLLHWLGGVGIIVMAILMLPFLRVGGMQLFRAESSDRTEKLLPSLTAITQQIVLAYVILTAACTMALIAAGMDSFDAVNHAFAALGTGGFSTKDASVGAFANPTVEWVLTLFMFLASLPFVMYVALLNGRPELFFADTQIRAFAALSLMAIALLAAWLVLGLGQPIWGALRAASFNAISIISTTGFASEDYTLWGPPAAALFLALTIVGGCTGSSAGGLKTFRFVILFQATRAYLVSLFQPNRVQRVRYGNRPLDGDIITAVLSFAFLFMGTWGLFTVVLGALGCDLVTAVSATAASIANVGPGLGEFVGPAGNYKSQSDAVKWVLSLAMLLGRLEFFTVLVLLHPAFWRT
jgi:trk system potassium uptake protein